MYLKRKIMPKSWPVERKGTKYLAKPNHGLENVITVILALRDILNIVKNRKEAKKLMNLGKIEVNGKKVKDEKMPLSLFDILGLDDKKFKVVLKNKKMGLEKTDKINKICKVKDKKLVKGNKQQVNLSDGRNYISDKKINTGDSVIIDFKKNQISDVLKLEKGSRVLFISGKHMGQEGKIEEMKKEEIIVKIKKDKVNTKQESLIVIG